MDGKGFVKLVWLVTILFVVLWANASRAQAQEAFLPTAFILYSTVETATTTPEWTPLGGYANVTDCSFQAQSLLMGDILRIGADLGVQHIFRSIEQGLTPHAHVLYVDPNPYPGGEIDPQPVFTIWYVCTQMSPEIPTENTHS